MASYAENVSIWWRHHGTYIHGVSLVAYLYDLFELLHNVSVSSIRNRHLISNTTTPQNGVWWCHQMETFSALLAFCAGNSPVTGDGHRWIPRTKASDEELWCFLWFDLRLNKRLSKQSWGWWFETPSRSLWRHCNGVCCLHPRKWHHVGTHKLLRIIVNRQSPHHHNPK